MVEEDRQLIVELQQFTVCQLTDGLGHSCPIETAIRPLDAQFRICGPALTVECAPGDNLTAHYALHIAQPGDVLVISGSPNCNAALWGELMSISAQSKKLAGTIVDGPARDPLEIRSLGYPVFCRDIHPGRAAKEEYGRINVPVHIGSVSVNPQDIVLADANGIVFLPRARVAEAIRAAHEVVRKEQRVKELISAGRTIFEIFELERYVTSDQQQAAKAK